MAWILVVFLRGRKIWIEGPAPVAPRPILSEGPAMMKTMSGSLDNSCVSQIIYMEHVCARTTLVYSSCNAFPSSGMGDPGPKEKKTMEFDIMIAT